MKDQARSVPGGRRRDPTTLQARLQFQFEEHDAATAALTATEDHLGPLQPLSCAGMLPEPGQRHQVRRGPFLPASLLLFVSGLHTADAS